MQSAACQEWPASSCILDAHGVLQRAIGKWNVQLAKSGWLAAACLALTACCSGSKTSGRMGDGTAAAPLGTQVCSEREGVQSALQPTNGPALLADPQSAAVQATAAHLWEAGQAQAIQRSAQHGPQVFKSAGGAHTNAQHTVHGLLRWKASSSQFSMPRSIQQSG